MVCAPDVLSTLHRSIPQVYQDPFGPSPSVFAGCPIVVDPEMAEGEWRLDPQPPIFPPNIAR
jgi:hypothetical protein